MFYIVTGLNEYFLNNWAKEEKSYQNVGGDELQANAPASQHALASLPVAMKAVTLLLLES